MKIALYSKDGAKKGDVTLEKSVFDIEWNEGLVHKALVYQMNNARTVLAHTKTKAEIRGGGRKPHRQKGTGWARQGSTRSPHMVGGGVAFGPRNTRNFKTSMPKKERRKALFSTLSEKAREESVIAIEDFEYKEPKTKKFATLLGKLPIKRDVLVILPTNEDSIKEANGNIVKSGKNIPTVKTLYVNYLNVADLLKYHTVLFHEDALGQVSKIFTVARSAQKN